MESKKRCQEVAKVAAGAGSGCSACVRFYLWAPLSDLLSLDSVCLFLLETLRGCR